MTTKYFASLAEALAFSEANDLDPASVVHAGVAYGVELPPETQADPAVTAPAPDTAADTPDGASATTDAV